MSTPTYEPKHRRTLASIILSFWIGLLSLPMLTGKFLATDLNDQYDTGYAFRQWASDQWLLTGKFPLWNPEIYGGMPFVGGMHGDLFYPTAWLRLLLPTHVGMNLGFLIHFVLAGVFTYWFLRKWKVSWTGSVVGGLAFQLSGLVASYVSPGHDGKLFVTALLPLGLIALTMAIRDRRWVGYPVFALVVGLTFLSPHPQMAQYFLVATGLYTLYLAFAEESHGSIKEGVLHGSLALAAVLAGLCVAAIQLLPMFAYIPYSPRHSEVLDSFTWSTAFSIPWEHVPEFFLSRFTGESFSGAAGTYWGPNGLKLHSEYLSLPVVALAIVGVLHRDRRQMVLWLGGIGVLFLLVALGGETPFYRLWWTLVPYVKATRAPGMAFFVVAFIVAVFAAFGVESLERRERRVVWSVCLFVGCAVVLLGIAGVIGTVAHSIAISVETATRFPAVQRAVAAQQTIKMGAMVSGLALTLVAGVVLAYARNRLPMQVCAMLLAAVVGTDLWWNAKPFWMYSRAHEEVFAPDPIKDFLQEQARPYRVWNAGVYGGSSLMADQIAQWYGHHGYELNAFDVLNGRRGQGLSFENAGHPNLLDLYAIEYLIIPTGDAPDSIPGYVRVMSGAQASNGQVATLYQSETPREYARFISAAAKVEFDQAVATVLDPRFPTKQVVLLEPDAPVHVGPLPEQLPEPSDVSVEFEDWRPGIMRIRAAPAAPNDGFLVISENHYPAWRAFVDGVPTPTVRGNGALLTVPVVEGTTVVELEYLSEAYRIGKWFTVLSVPLIVAAMAGTVAVTQPRAGGYDRKTTPV